MNKSSRIIALFALTGLSLLAGCRQDMHDQPKFLPQRGTSFYEDGRSVRPQIADTVARGQLHDDAYFYTGLINGKEGTALPFPVTPDVLARGQERYNVYCSPCHSRVGNGGGRIVERGYAAAGNMLGTRLRNAGIGHFFNVITKGYGAMPDYAAQLSPQDRWAVAAYIRALQLSQGAQRSDVPSGAQVRNLVDIAHAEGLPESFAAEWITNPPAPVPGADSVEPPSDNPDTAPVSVAPRSAAAKADIVSAPPAKPATPAASGNAAAGKTIYLSNCKMCHKEDLSGNPPVFPSLKGVVARIGAEKVRNTVHNGSPPMRAFPEFSSGDLDDLVAFLSSAAKAGASPEVKKSNPDVQ